MRDDEHRTMPRQRPRSASGGTAHPRSMYVIEGGLKDNKKPAPPAYYGKKARYNDGGVVFGFALFILVAYLSGYLYMFGNRERITETVVDFGSIEPVVVYTGVITRDETVYYANAGGVIVYHKQDGEKVAAGGVAASIQDEEAVRRNAETLSFIENNLRDSGNVRNYNPAVENELRTINTQLVRTIDSYALSANAADLNALYTLTFRAEQIVDNRNRILYNESSGVSGTYQERISGAYNQIKTEHSGILCYKTDGYEGIYTTERLKVLSPEEVAADVDYGSLYIPKAVEPGDPVFKTINSNTWYIVTYLPLEQVSDWSAGAQKTIYVDDGTGIYSNVETKVHSIERSAQNAYVVFSINRGITDYLNYRSLSFKIKKTLSEGLKIPNSAIVEKTLLKIPAECVIQDEDKTKQVLRVNQSAGSTEIVTIIPFTSDMEFVSIIMDYNNIHLNDILIVPERIQEVRHITELENIHGVYVTNTGAALFKRIHLSGEVYENVNYTIIDPQINSSVKVKDRIVTDARNIEENQRIN